MTAQPSIIAQQSLRINRLTAVPFAGIHPNVEAQAVIPGILNRVSGGRLQLLSLRGERGEQNESSHAYPDATGDTRATLETMKSQLDVVAHIQAAPGEEVLVREVLNSYLAPTRLEDGCLRYDLFVDIDDATKFTFIEEWTSAEALFKHSQSAHLAAGRARLDGKLAQPAQVFKLNQIG